MAKNMYDYWNNAGEQTDQFSTKKDLLSSAKRPTPFNTKPPEGILLVHVPQTSKQNGRTPNLNEVERGGWGNKLDFLFSCISVSVGLGNVWRFPYLCYKNGGGRYHFSRQGLSLLGDLLQQQPDQKSKSLSSQKEQEPSLYEATLIKHCAFLVTYTIAMIFCGIPIFFQEVAVGQYLGAGGMTLVGELVPILQGVGYATMTIVFFLDIYYCIIIAWTVFYLISSFVALPGLPWQDCDNWWNSETCFAPGMDPYVVHNRTNHTTTPVEEFWDKRVLQITGGIHDLGEMQWELFGCLFLGWVLVYLIIRRGIHQSGKIIWFTALFPYVVLFVLLVRAVTLEGAGAGLLYYVTPRWEELLGSRPWLDGATQIFFAYSIGTGALPALGSYNKFYHNCYKDAIITCIVNTLTCLLAGCVTFAILGHIAAEQETEVSEVVKSGPGLVFLTYPEVVLKLPGAPAWAAIFFSMLVILGIDSEFCIVESFITGIVDNWSERLRPHRNKITLGICFLMFLLGIPMTTQGGAYIFQLMDFYSASGMCLLFVCFFQTIAISWIFGAQRFNDCIYQMMGIRLNKFWLFCWTFLAPGIMATIFIFYVVQYKPVSYGKDYEYPWWAQEIGFAMSFSSMVWIPLYAIYYVFSSPGTVKENIQLGLKPKFKSRVQEATAQPTSSPVIPLSESSAVLIKNGSFLSN